MYIVLAILIFGLLIFIHELGHYLTARLFKVKIYEFSIGMGPKFASFRSKKTDIKYSLGILPFGGYVSMAGEDQPDDDKSAPDAKSEAEPEAEPEAQQALTERETDENALCNKPAWQRFIILSAGSLMNILFGIVLMCILVSSFKQLSTTTVKGFYLKEDTGFEISSYESGLRAGDEIIEVDGKRVHIANQLGYHIMRKGYEPIELTVIRDGEEKTLLITFPTVEEQGQVLGMVDFATETTEKTFFGTVEHAFYYSTSTVRMIWESFYDLLTGRYGFEAVSGPVGVTAAIGEAAKVGIPSVVYLTVVIALNLGIMNLLPIPALDGGRLFFVIVEMIFRRPIPAKIQNAANAVGLVLMFALIIVIMFKDTIQLIIS